jgi:uncharacterized protein YdhG (YjbR/CyaY superfamily)
MNTAVFEQYFTGFQTPLQDLLQKVRTTIQAAAPEATEKICYGIPTFYLQGNLVHFAIQKNHLGFYPAPSGIKAFESELGSYKYSKGAIQFPLDRPVPFDLIRRIVEFRVEENLAKKAKNKQD